ncbi:flagellar hook-basal body complex protein FliE [Helicobacter canadensis]|uniref:Flagellar hook-basal body complex protein FliE n=1 Tax=Helicobacter canadensis MIT 98-5491 TaxID=537970 RepID=C5ZV46_9HELI|nr:flagellar hook-basal body complex protein FliE [Helicobacter canadensis]EES89110.1 flagellar basal body protein [Helicobacter canadensis MIT 98-5491]EFR47887.1 flagellar hook-basal body complex protein FliE [Helicobacter canadensis MIT 98-5491]STO99141.1 putative flagellar hook-basal body complex protein [Helicobacter canadensis]
MEINKYGIDAEKINSQLKDVPNLSPNHNLNPPNKSFENMLKDAFEEVNEHQKTTEQAMADMATGQIKDIHQAAIAIGKAENSMKLMLEVRNKAISAYKELIRTQI